MNGKSKFFQKVTLSIILFTALFFISSCKKEEASKVKPSTIMKTVTEKKPGLFIINFDGLRSDGGFSYKISYVIDGGDSNDEPEKSALRLFENGVELHPAHSTHQGIRDYGKGRFSHWGTTLYFSTSDNTDPVTNGREYTYTLNGAGYTASNSSSKVQIGAYYFDGWAAAPTQNNITNLLVKNFSEREPIWGWKTSTSEAMVDQIDLAANAGLSFFDFCWYYDENLKSNFQDDPYNHALGLYLKAPNNNKLKYCIIVCNQKGYEIGPEDWSTVTAYWISLFKSDRYLKFNGKPYITLLNVAGLVSKFGSVDAVKKALNDFRQSAIKAGFSGVSIGGCASYDNTEISQGLHCEFDLITGYNYHQAAFSKDVNPTPIENLIANDYRSWDNISNCFKIPYVPTASLNWDSRPQARNSQDLISFQRFSGFSSGSVYQAVSSLKKWLINNPNKTLNEGIGVIFAWNEYGEGSWLTPSKNQTESLLDGVKQALNN
jgi:hypothetical protein